ncbi:MAG: hypothetical protein ACOCZU_06630 [Planctomycetota bacterium]
MSEVSVTLEVDPSAHVSPQATLGPYCVIGPNVTIGPRTVLERRVSVLGSTSIGSDNHFAEGCVIGGLPQDLKYEGSRTRAIIGHRNRFGREATVHIGTEQGGFITRIGNDNVLKDRCHVAHDCYVDDETDLGVMTLLAGHIHVECGAVIGDMVGLHHFTTVGRYARVAAQTPVRRDVPPYTEFGHREDDSVPAVRGIHTEGINAADLRPEERRDLEQALEDLFSDETALQTKIEQIVNLGVEGEVASLCEFCQRSLAGVYGRHRERERGKIPPEALEWLTPAERAWFRRNQE